MPSQPDADESSDSEGEDSTDRSDAMAHPPHDSDQLAPSAVYAKFVQQGRRNFSAVLDAHPELRGALQRLHEDESLLAPMEAFGDLAKDQDRWAVDADLAQLTFETCVGPEKMFGAYRLDWLIAEGGMGQVWRATEFAVGRTQPLRFVALKVIRPQVLDGAILARFEREARITAGLRHPNFVRLYTYGIFDGLAWIAMEYVGEGRTLRDLARESSGREVDLDIVTRRTREDLRLDRGSAPRGALRRCRPP